MQTATLNTWTFLSCNVNSGHYLTSELMLYFPTGKDFATFVFQKPF